MVRLQRQCLPARSDGPCQSDLDQSGGGDPQPARRDPSTSTTSRADARLATGCGAPSVLADNDDYPGIGCPRSAPAYRSVLRRPMVRHRRCRRQRAAKAGCRRGGPIAGSTARFTRWIFRFSWRTRGCATAWSSGSASSAFIFSITGIVIGWRRLDAAFERSNQRLLIVQ